MTNSILIGQAINRTLRDNSALTEYVGTRIYPVIVDEDVEFPFVVFYRNNISSASDKMGVYEDSVSYSVVAVAETYAESCYIANEIRKSLEFKKRVFEDLELFIYDSKLSGVNEGYIANSYVQTLTFTCTTH